MVVEKDLDGLLDRAFATRRARSSHEVVFSAPSFKHYRSAELPAPTGVRFAALSVTGRRCDLGCEHCRGTLLEPMVPAVGPGALVAAARRLAARGCRGLLVSGGCDAAGRVPLGPALDEIREIREGLGLTVAVHVGLVGGRGARALARTGVDRVMIDLVGDRETARRVLHLDVGPDRFEASLAALVDAGLAAVPHVVAGLCFGRLRGEDAAVEMAARHEVAGLVVVVLRPERGTAMEGLAPTPAEGVARLLATARLALPDRPLHLGCARPVGEAARALESLALRAGVDGVAFPADETVRLARQLGLRPRLAEQCCALSADPV